MEQNIESSAGSGFSRGLEWVLVLVGALLNTVIVALFAGGQAATPGASALQNLYPFPLLYFIEIIGFSFLAILGLNAITPQSNRGRWTQLFPWIAAGGLLAFVLLGGFSIGFYLIPGMLTFITAGILADRRQNRSIAGHATVLILVAIFQVTIMLVVATIQ
jgi:hypothetical protein